MVLTRCKVGPAEFALALCAAATLAAFPASAQDRGGPPEWTGSVGLGVGVAPDYEGSNDYQAIPAPRLELRKGGYGVKTNRLGLEADLTASRRLNAGPIIRYDLGRDDDVEDSRVSLLDEVDPSLEIGGYVSYAFPVELAPGDFGFVRLSTVQDVAGGHDGFVAEASAGYFTPIGRDFRAGAILATSYASNDYMESFFEVDAVEAARSGLSQSDADGGFKDVGLTLTLTYALNDRWDLTSFAGYKRLIGDAADSSVVDEAGSENQAFGAIGLSYGF